MGTTSTSIHEYENKKGVSMPSSMFAHGQMSKQAPPISNQPFNTQSSAAISELQVNQAPVAAGGLRKHSLKKQVDQFLIDWLSVVSSSPKNTGFSIDTQQKFYLDDPGAYVVSK